MRLGRAKITAFTAMAAALVLLTTFRAGPPQTASASRPVLTPSPTVEPTPMLASEYEQRLLYDVEYIEGLLCFIVVVVLCFFSYKFFRIFF